MWKRNNMIKNKIASILSDSSSSILIILLISLLSCDLISCSRNSNFFSPPTTVRASENDTGVILPCEYYLPPHYVRWFLEDEVIADSRDESSSEKYAIWQNGSLQVNDVKASDAGEYVCEVMTDAGLDSQFHSIEVQYPPSVISSMSGMVEVKIGSIFDIVCEARGVPPPMIYWRRSEDHNVTEKFKNTPRYMMEVNSNSLSGPLECVASNGVGEPAVAGIFLVVLFEPTVRAVTRFVHTKVGMRAFLECEVTSSPPAKVYWFHRNAPVTADSRNFAMSSADLNPNRTAAYYHSHKKHTLTLKNVHETQLGMYECKAENEIGLKSAHIELAGRPMPSIFKQSPVASLPTTHNLIWTTESFSPIIEYSLKFRQIPSGNILPENRGYDTKWKELTIPGETTDGPLHSIGYTLRGLMAGTVYEAAVASRNRFGWSDISKIIKFHTGYEGQPSTYPTEISQYNDIETNYFDSSPQESSLYDDNAALSLRTNCFFVFLTFLISFFVQQN
ncbi:hemicentin-1 [Culicoides brevitarsis]|uniref:hemicentin-1 n=1 Tax=Culicoides brevitarsis TaxID=469753 RepID=UPI00307B4982